MIGLLVMLIFLLLSETPFMRSIEGYGYDLAMRFSSDKQAHEDIVVVAIDDKSLQALGSWPWSRDLLAQGTRQLAKSRPKVVGFNMPFDIEQGKQAIEVIDDLRNVLKKQKVLKRSVRRALESAEANLNNDEKLADSLRSAGRIVLAMPYLASNASNDVAAIELPDYLHKFSISGKSAEAWKALSIANASLVFPPVEVLSKQVGGVGVTSSYALDDQVRQQSMMVAYGERYLPAFPLIMMARHKGLSAYHLNAGDKNLLRLDNQPVLTDKQLAIYPRFYIGDENKSAFKMYSFIDLLNGDIATSEFRRKTVIIGVTATQQVAAIMTPTGEMMSATLVVAHTLSSLLNQESYQVPHWAGWAQKLAIVVIGLYLMILTRLRKTSGLFVSIFLLLILVNAEFLLMSLQSTWVPLMAAVGTLLVGHVILGGRQLEASRLSGVRFALSDANRQLGQSCQAQGQLDQAFEKFKLCEVDEPLLNQLYNLGLDYERKRQFNKAESVFKFIRDEKSNYNDVGERIRQNQHMSEAVVLGGSAATNTNASLIIDKKGVEKPKLGRYQIDKEIGRGAMGMVYLGHDDKIGRTVAIKTMMLSEEIEPNKRDAVKSRFFREAEAAGRLDHPNIVTVYDVGDEEDLAYIAMDYLKGKDLTAYCKKKKLLPISRVFEIIMSVADALDYAHQQHVVHRDIKPANIIFNNAKNVAKLTDFGVACLTDASKTKTGTVLGSPYYMSPEQLAGKKVDGRSDLFSLGVTLYQLLTGELPFASDSMANLMYKITNEKHPDIRSFRADVPSCVNTLINKTLHKDITKRFQTGSQMVASMKRCYEKIIEVE